MDFYNNKCSRDSIPVSESYNSVVIHESFGALDCERDL